MVGDSAVPQRRRRLLPAGRASPDSRLSGGGNCRAVQQLAGPRPHGTSSRGGGGGGGGGGGDDDDVSFELQAVLASGGDPAAARAWGPAHRGLYLRCDRDGRNQPLSLLTTLGPTPSPTPAPTPRRPRPRPSAIAGPRRPTASPSRAPTASPAPSTAAPTPAPYRGLRRHRHRHHRQCRRRRRRQRRADGFAYLSTTRRQR